MVFDGIYLKILYIIHCENYTSKVYVYPSKENDQSCAFCNKASKLQINRKESTLNKYKYQS